MTETKTKSLAALLALLCVAACAMLIACSAPSSSSDASSASSDRIESSAAQDKTAVDTTGSRYILVMGDDEWEGEPHHADMMCLLRVDLDNHRVYEITVPRDTKYDFGGGDFGKLNNVLTRKGAEAQVQAVSSVVGVPIDYYVKIGFDAFEKIVDHFGGIGADLPYSINYDFYTEDFPDEHFDAGEQTLSGWRAMALSRARTGYGDIGVDDQEMVRQFVDRQMLTTLMQLAYKGGTDAIEPLFSLFKDSVETNMTLDEMVGWAKALGSSGTIEVIGTTGPFRGADDADTDLWLVTPDPEGWANLMAAVESDGSIYEATNTYAYSVFPAPTPATTTTQITVGS